MLRKSKARSMDLSVLFRQYRNPILIGGGALLVVLVIVCLAAALAPVGQDAVLEAIAPATVEPIDMMGLIVSESRGIPLEASGAACLTRDDLMEQAAELFSQPGLEVQAYLEGEFSGAELETAERHAQTLAWIADIARDKCFPFTEDVNYDYSDGWGMGRSDNRKHEGIDIFADHGTPIVSVCDGVVEKKGWLNLGGWRLGIRGEDDVYYYYAHMSEYADVEVGDTIKKGQIIGYVGDTGYGPEGTTGQFVAHLHFGMYQGKDDTEKAFSPYPFLALWDPYETPSMEAIGNPDVY